MKFYLFINLEWVNSNFSSSKSKLHKLEIGIIKLAKIKLVCITYELFRLFNRFYEY